MIDFGMSLSSDIIVILYAKVNIIGNSNLPIVHIHLQSKFVGNVTKGEFFQVVYVFA
jgi:hypothetical protein